MISVIIPHYRAGGTIERALQSVAVQTRPASEVIVVDDGSGSAESVLDDLQRRPWPFTLRIIRLPENVGPGEARNAGWASADAGSRWVAFLDADDEWLPQKLAVQIGWMEQHPQFAWTAHTCSWAQQDNAETPDGVRVRSRHLTVRSLLWRSRVATPSVVARSELKLRFRAGWRRCEDLMLWLDWLCAGEQGAFLETRLCVLGRKPATGGGLTGDLASMHSAEVRVLRTLCAENRIGSFEASLWAVWLRLKYWRRRL